MLGYRPVMWQHFHRRIGWGRAPGRFAWLVADPACTSMGGSGYHSGGSPGDVTLKRLRLTERLERMSE